MTDFGVDIAIACARWRDALPELADLAGRALKVAATHTGAGGHVDVLFTDDARMHKLNLCWRGKDKPTDILSFAGDGEQSGANGYRFLGDLALGYGSAVAGAGLWQRAMDAYVSHLLVHGFLHLLGYNHESEPEERIMQGVERDILDLLGISDPYS